MPFEDFVPQGGRTRFSFPAVTVMRSGGIALNEAAYKAMGAPSHVVLAFDQETRRIGIRAAVQSVDAGYRLTRVSSDSWWVSARAFLAYYDLTFTATAKYRAKADGAYITISLDDAPLHRERRVKPEELEPEDLAFE
jgi:hypothetical protein